MKKLLLIGVFLPLFLACSSDDSDSGNSPTLEVTVDPINSLNVTVRWTYSGQGSTVYRILLNDEVIEENYSGNQYTFQIANETAYQGTIFAIAQNDEETFQNFSFSTVGNDTWYGPLHYSPLESTPELPYRIVTGELTLKGNINTILPKIQNLEEVGSLRLDDVDGMTSLEPFSNLKFHNSEGWVVVTHCNDITSLSGLQNMNGHVSGLSLFQCPNINDVSGVQFADMVSIVFNGLPNLTSFSGLNPPQNLKLLRIKNMGNLETLQGLENIQLVEDLLEITNLDNITSLQGFENVQQVGGELELIGNDNLTNINALGSLTDIGGLYIQLQPELTSLAGLENIQTIRNQFYLINTGITSLETLTNCSRFVANTETNKFSILIEDNDSLTSLNGLENVTFDPNGSTSGYCFIEIKFNNQLADFCGIQDFLISVPNGFEFQGTIDWNQLFNPSLEDIMNGNCSL